MSATVPIALLGWILVVVVMFLSLKPHRAIIASIIGGYLFLPKAQWTIASGLPDWSSDAAVSIYTLACAAVFAPAKLATFRPNKWDLFIAAGLLGWGISSILAGYGIKQAVIDWWFYINWAVIPYFLARCYLTSGEQLRDLALGLLIGLLIYIPLIVFEARFYPQLNRTIYGFQIDRGTHIARLDGYRPIVFMARGLALGIWVAMSVVIVWSLYLSNRPKSLLKMPLSIIAAASLVAGILTRSTGAIGLMLAGVSILLAIRATRWQWLAIIPSLIVALYLGTGVIARDVPLREASLVLLSPLVSQDRINSLATRFNHEALLADHASQRLLFGFGGWGDYRDVDSATVREQTGFKRIITDGFWIITLGQRGVVGTAATFGWMLVPAILSVLLLYRRSITASDKYVIIGLSLWSSLYAADLLLNGFISPVQGAVAGALLGFVARYSSRPTYAPLPVRTTVGHPTSVLKYDRRASM